MESAPDSSTPRCQLAPSCYFYTTTKNRKRTPDKLVFKKYDPVARKHVEFRETKIK